jgi:GntR family transcriptional regulator
MITSAQFQALRASAEILQTSPRRVHNLIRTAIRDGMLQQDDRLIENYLIRELGSSRNAVREGLQLLACEGLVSREPRAGTTVIGKVVRIMIDDIVSVVAAEEVTIVRLDDRQVPSNDLIRSRLQTDATRVGMIEHLFLFDGQPIGIRVAYYHAHVRQPEGWQHCPDLPTAFNIVFGLPLGHVQSTVEAVPLDSRTSRILDLPVGSTSLVKEQILYDISGIPQEFTYAHYRADRVSFMVTNDHVPARQTAGEPSATGLRTAPSGRQARVPWPLAGESA